jgi:pimeloyl-ACP methyl ester carboxylesterase
MFFTSRASLLLFLSTILYAAPCTKGTADCTEWVKFPSGTARSLIYRTHSLDEKNPNITRALIMVHGASRDADNYFRSAVAAAFLAGALEDTIVISPRFASGDRSCKDKLDKNEVSWSCNGDSWRSGGNAVSNPELTSYDFADEILRKLAHKDLFPNLKSVVVTGHSAGGQFVTRYQMASKVYDTLGLAITYVVSNPSSYAYLDETRPTADGKDFHAFSDARNCTTYNSWPYGLAKRTGYTAGIPDDKLKKQMAERPLVYLLGEIDILPLGGFDSSCPAMAQGPTRRARGEAYAKYVNERFNAHHTVTIVPLCGHNGRCMFTSEAALPIIFPKQ